VIGPNSSRICSSGLKMNTLLFELPPRRARTDARATRRPQGASRTDYGEVNAERFRREIQLSARLQHPRDFITRGSRWLICSTATTPTPCEIQNAARLDPELAVRQGHLAYIYRNKGRNAEAAAIHRILEQRSAREKVSPVALVFAHIGLGENDAALGELHEQWRPTTSFWSPLGHCWWIEFTIPSDPIRDSSES
jgi:hypothetical protein